MSYGQVRNFFLRNHCRSLRRELFALADPDGDAIVVSIIRVGMRSSHDARRLWDLIDVYGTGDIVPRASVVLGLRGIDFDGKHYASRRRGRSLVIAETEPVSGTPSDAFLEGVAKIATWFPK